MNLVILLALSQPAALPQSTLMTQRLPQSTYVPIPEPVPAPKAVCPCPCECHDGICDCNLNCDCPACPARFEWVRSDHPGYLSLLKGGQQVGVYEVQTGMYFPESQRASWSSRKASPLPAPLPAWHQRASLPIMAGGGGGC